MKRKRNDPEHLARLSAVLALAALALICWSVLVPKPIPVVVSMTAGQVLGTLSFALFLYVIFLDVRTPDPD